jgi:ABC-2 type transport system ATP-binding protein
MLAIEAVALAKKFGSRQVLRDLTLRVSGGEVYGLLGPNGVGKTTFIHLLLGFLRPDAGRIAVLGHSPGAARGRIGYVPEQAEYHAHFTPREYLRSLGRFNDLRGGQLEERCDNLLELVALTADADRRIGRFSKGMLQRLGVAQALIGNPELMLLDEPTSGLDPGGQHEVLKLLAQLRELGQTILMCSHQLSEVEAVCDRVGILNGGRLAAEASVAQLHSGRVTIVIGRPRVPGAVAAALTQRLGPGVVVSGREVHVSDADSLAQRALRFLVNADIPVLEVRPSLFGLSELYLSAINDHPVSPGKEDAG